MSSILQEKTRRKSLKALKLRRNPYKNVVRFDLTSLTHFVSHKGLRLGRERQGVKTLPIPPTLLDKTIKTICCVPSISRCLWTATRILWCTLLLAVELG